MIDNIFDFIVHIPQYISPFFEWLFQRLPYINLMPIEILSFAGIGVILTLHLIHLVNVVSG